MKIISTHRFVSLLEKEKTLNSIKKEFPNNQNYLDYISSLSIIDEIIKYSESLFNSSIKDLSVNDFYNKLNQLSKYLGKILEYDFIVFGYKNANSLIDLAPYFQGEELVTDSLRNLKEVEFHKSFVGQLLSKSNEPYIWQSEIDGNILDYSNFLNSNKSFEIDNYGHARLKDYFNFIPDGPSELVICPISVKSTENHSPLGYLILANKKSKITPSIEFKILKTLGYYLVQVFKNQSTIFQLDKDARFISEIYEMFFNEGIVEILDFCNSEFSLEYSSFWVPTKEEEEIAFGLRACNSTTLDNNKLSICYEQDFYLGTDCILGEIYNNNLKPEFNNIHVIRNPNQDNTGFKSLGEVIKSNFLIVFPIIKYSNSRLTLGHENEDIILGYFCFYISDRAEIEQLPNERIHNFMDQISFYIEHILYDHTFHTLELISKDLFKIDDITDVPKYYNNLVATVNEVMNSEHTSIFFPNEDGELYLKSSTSKEFWKVDRENKDIFDTLDKLEYENVSISPIYNSLDSITFRSYTNKNTIIIHDIHDKNIKADCSFYEATKTFHKSAIFCPVVENGKCVAVIRCINKKEFNDSLLKTYTFHDADTLELICSFIASQHQKIQSFDQQQLFIEKLAHENKTPVSLIWGAIENIEIKLSDTDFYKEASLTKHFENIMFATSVLNNNYGNLNAFLKNKERKLSYHFEYIELKEKIEEISKLLKPFLQKLENKSVIFNLQIHEMPKVKVDETRMYQVIYNLIHNAIRYCEPSSTISIFFKANKSIDLKGEFINCFELRFENYGIGIPQEDTDKIFIPYYRSENAKRVNPNGTGIGLHVTKTIVEGHGGIISVTKNTKPTIISVFLPNTLIQDYEKNIVV